MQFLEGIEKLGKRITSKDAERFQAWSDRYFGQEIPLFKILDEGSTYLLTTKIERNEAKLGL